MAPRPARQRRRTQPLPERLVEAVEKLLQEDGLAGLSLREVARRAGVTHGAPLRHYPSFATLLAEVAARGFRSLAEAVEAAAAAVPVGAGAPVRLAAAARAYLACAIEHPERFALMFRPELLDVRQESFARDATAAFEGLVRHVRAAQDAGFRADADARALAGSLWASIHGLASLWSQGAYTGAVGDVSLDAAATSLIELLLGGPAAAATRAPSTRRRT
jgi:AcrR family transcriptional regulator